MNMKKLLFKDFTVVLLILFILFILRFGIDVLNPTSTNWILSAYHDWGQHYLGWAFFREEPINFPIGKIENYNFPAGTTVGYTDSIPLMAYLCKLLDFMLPATFQYLGFWLLLSHLLTGYFALKIIKRYSNNYVINILVAVFIAFTPVILYRDMHPALTSHWLIVGSLYYYLKINEDNFSKIYKKILFFNVLAALINPYLLILTFSISFFSYIKMFYFYKKSIKGLNVIKELAYQIFLVIFIWVLTGMLSFTSGVNMEVVNSYGLYSLNLNSFFNSESLSQILPAFPKTSWFQYEGYSYFGIGGFVLIFVGIVLYFTDFRKNLNKSKKVLPVFILSIFFLLFAISNKVTFNESIIFEFEIPSLISKIGSIFRATSRFVWLFYYFIIIISFIILLKSKINQKLKTVIIVFICLLQFYDVSAFFNKNLPKGKYELSKFSTERWINLTSNFKKIITYSPFNNHLSNPMDYQDLCLIALKNKLPITIGYVARESSETNKKFIDSLNLQIKECTFNQNDIFVVSSKDLHVFKSAIYQNILECKKLDSYFILYLKSKKLKSLHFESSAEKTEVDKIKAEIANEFKFEIISKPVISKNKIKANIEEFIQVDNQLFIDGWAFIPNSNHLNNSIYVAIVGENKTYLLNTTPKDRPDLPSHFKDKNLGKSGFICKNITTKFEPGKYLIYIGVKENETIYYELLNDKVVNVKKSLNAEILKEIPVDSENVIFNVEKSKKVNNSYLIEGWAGLKNTDSYKNTIKVALLGVENYQLDVNYYKRPDVTGNFAKTLKKNYDDSGFNVLFKKQNIIKGKYQIAIIVLDKNKNQNLVKSDKTLIIN